MKKLAIFLATTLFATMGLAKGVETKETDAKNQQATGKEAAASTSESEVTSVDVASNQQEQRVVFSGAYIKPAEAGKNTAAYVTIDLPEGAEGKPVIISIQAKDELEKEGCFADKVEMHDINQDNKMINVDRLEVPAILKQGGKHIMVFGLKDELKEGSSVAFVVKFEDGSTQEFVAEVRAEAPQSN